MRVSCSATSEKGSCLIVMVSKKGLEKKLSSPISRLSDRVMREKLFKAEQNETLFLPCVRLSNYEHLLLVGLGEPKEMSPENFRQAAAAAYKQLEQHSLSSAEIDLSLCVSLLKNTSALVQAIREGLTLSCYNFEDLKAIKADKKSVKKIVLTGIKPTSEIKTILETGQILAESTNFARWLADHPANLMTPSVLAQEVQKKFRDIKGTQVNVWNKERIKKEKMGGVLGVSLGSSQDPRVIIIEYKGHNQNKSPRPLCFVGKGLTFDSGGISIKPSKNMDEMKFDMCGSVAVIGALLAIARLKLKVNVIGIMGATENMPGASAIKPGDVLTARNGKTMEVLNTDAEGRLVLADLLSYVSEKKPEFIVDAATLTGAVVVALGNVYTGLFTRNQSLEKQIRSAAACSEEKIWPLPLDHFHVKDIKSKVADVANISSTPGAGSSTAAAFLEHFVDKNIPWAHLDIAGTAYNVSNRLPYCRPKSASGVMVRTFVELARQYVR
ncbi:MAG: leucyl aminopeptidase [Bdellovibrionales bacterium]|nr:leucyl aminopeptidase [Bdellovibrionales bacterium]